MDAVYPDKPIIEGGQTSTGSVIAWFKRHFAPNTTFDALNEEAAKIEPGCEGLLVLDHFQGNRTPYTDALSRGAITGLTLKHTPAHVYRAIIEGICLGTKLIVENFGAAFTPKRIVVAGGATNSPLWLQIHADTIGAPLELTEVPDAPALGCAILAAHGAERFGSIEEGAEAMVRTARTIEPNAANAQRYESFYPQYRELYAALKRSVKPAHTIVGRAYPLSETRLFHDPNLAAIPDEAVQAIRASDRMRRDHCQTEADAANPRFRNPCCRLGRKQSAPFNRTPLRTSENASIFLRTPGKVSWRLRKAF